MRCLTVIALATLGLSFGPSAFAQSSSSELTRADVRAQLIQAESQGLVPSGRIDYPPSARTIARNRAIYEAQHKSVPNVASSTDDSVEAGSAPSGTPASD